MEKVYVIKDSNNRFGGNLDICSNSITGRGDYKWDYYSTIYPTTWYEGVHGRINLENEISELYELNLLAEYDLDWVIVEFNSREDIAGLFIRGSGSWDSSIVVKDVKKGFVGKYRKCVREIKRKYKGVEINIGGISDEYIDQIVKLV